MRNWIVVALACGCSLGGRHVPEDGAIAADARAPDAGTGCEAPCAGECCAEGESCGGDRCCPNGDLCGGVCCGGDQACEGDRCVLVCGDGEVACDLDGDAVCCGSGELCYLGACVVPGVACEHTNDCAQGEYCDGAVGRCLPRAEGALCEHRPAGDLALAEEWAWTGDPEVLPAHAQVMMAPMVANLDDDDGDGDIDADDVPDLVFHSFEDSDYWADGVLRAISGDDGSRLWPTAEPGYRTTAGGDVAIADVDPSSPGPEIFACSESDRSVDPRVPGHLMMIAADGVLLRRFDTAPNDVPCGFDGPMVGDMDGDGVPEIVVRFVVAHADGTVVRRIRDIRDPSHPYLALSDVDADGDLDLVGSDAAYDYDGAPIWERGGALPRTGWIAIADLDLDGDPEIVIVHGGTTSHFVYAVDGATGETVWGPIDVNPPELAAEIAADGDPSGGGPPTIANLDADPFPEIALAGGFAYTIFAHDGAREWHFVTQDRSSRSTGSSVFDFDGDGVAEVLYNDELSFRIFRGTDGAVLHEECNTSGTLRELPIVVDADNDNQAEIVLVSNDYEETLVCGETRRGVRLLGHPRGEWVRTRRIFNQHGYHVTNVEEDGTIPARELENWSVPGLNNFRQNVQPANLFDAPDAALEDLLASGAACPSAIALSVRVVNRGAAGIPAGTPVTFYAESAGARTFLGRAATSRALLPGESERVELVPSFTIEPGTEGDAFRFVAVLNDPEHDPIAALQQCRTDNDEAAITFACPLFE